MEGLQKTWSGSLLVIYSRDPQHEPVLLSVLTREGAANLHGPKAGYNKDRICKSQISARIPSKELNIVPKTA